MGLVVWISSCLVLDAYAKGVPMKLRVDKYLVDLRDMMQVGYSIASLHDLAIDEARERARLYVMPCQWTSTIDPAQRGVFTVRRYRRV